MRTPHDLRTWARRRYASRHAGWLALPSPDAAGEHRFGLQPPVEADVGREPARVAAWIASWRTFEADAPAGVRVDWVSRRWSSFGVQSLPVAAVADGADALAALAGASEWPRLTRRARVLLDAWPDAPDLPAALPGMASRLAALPEPDLARLIAVVTWLRDHPASGLLPRQLPVAGVDTKWVERHPDLVRRCLAGLTGSPDLGLRVEARRFRVRLLDPAIGPDGPTDLTVTAATLDAFDVRPACVVVVENLESLAALPDLPGVAAVHGKGLAAPELASVRWLAGARIVYWGDLDTHGFRILGDVRRALPQTESVLMDADTWERFTALAVPEPQPYRGRIGHLTASENEALHLIRAGDWRLEQERIEPGYAFGRLRAVLGDAG